MPPAGFRNAGWGRLLPFPRVIEAVLESSAVFMLLGEMMEHSRTEDLFLNPKHPKTSEYIEGRYG